MYNLAIMCSKGCGGEVDMERAQVKICVCVRVCVDGAQSANEHVIVRENANANGRMPVCCAFLWQKVTLRMRRCYWRRLPSREKCPL